MKNYNPVNREYRRIVSDLRSQKPWRAANLSQQGRSWEDAVAEILRKRARDFRKLMESLPADHKYLNQHVAAIDINNIRFVYNVYEKGNIDGRTMSVEKWVNADPVSFDMVRRKYHLKITKEIFQVLMSKLRVNHREYYKDAIGLNMPIEFKGYTGKVPASIPYSNDPVCFYKWWKKAENADKITMSKAETIRLLIKVYQMEPSVLLIKHKQMITK